ncbi:hypothetical protein ACHAXR_000449, partial [Thalassiosira sp. AJA248-18]
MGQERAAIPEGVTCVRVDPSLTRIPPRTFQGLGKLEEVELCEGVEEIGDHAFWGCVSIRRITIPSTVARIHNYAFRDCTKLEEVQLPEGINEINLWAFQDCHSLRNITIPS